MKCLIAEDDFISRRILKDLLSGHFDCDIAINGEEAVASFRLSHEGRRPYDLICMDIMMPSMDGQEALRQIRQFEVEMGVPQPHEVKVIMTTALDDPHSVISSYYRGGATSYLVKPITRQKLMQELRQLQLIT
ncbi:response regulator [Geobacter sp. SVR]|uniref:response regulator n=1 Tax=Geobacter sp. SVR TaxID=2495594 RepID=UPI00143EFC66|nr:response regulator [Geobacter sp. SVR]BCS53729.1 response regulator [Geobacter sp. SVR]GCF85762.1 response regulator [Geobacter sp. SVR]